MRGQNVVSVLTAGGLVAGAAIVSSAQAPGQPAAGAHAMAGPSSVTKAIAVLHATKKGGEASGKVTFTMTGRGVRVEAHIHGLKPGLHGFHIHEFGDTS